MVQTFLVDREFDTAKMGHLASLDLDFHEKRVLEVAAGVGTLTHFWEERGCTIVSTEARKQNIETNLHNHPWRTDILFQVDLTRPDSHKEFGVFDIVFCYGVLYHVPDPRHVIHDLAPLCRELFLVESMVANDDGPPALNERQEFIGINQGLYSTACTPTRSWFMQELGEVFPHVYTTRTQPRNMYYRLTWPAPPGEISRAIFVASRTELASPSLTKALPRKQTYRIPQKENSYDKANVHQENTSAGNTRSKG